MNIASLLQGLASFSWLLVVGVIGLAVVRAARAKPLKGASPIIIGTIVFSLVLTTVSAGLVFIKPQDRDVVLSAFADGGMRKEILQPGLRWVIPFAENVIVYPISKQTYTMSGTSFEGQVTGDDSITARTSDGQQIYMDASILYALDPTEVIDVHIAWQDRYGQDLVRPLARGIIRDVASQYSVEEVVSSKRFEMSQQITDEMNEKLAENGLILVDFVLRNVTFSDEYAASVEQKQIAEQQAQQAKLVVEQRRQEAEQARQVAQGQADAVVIQAKGAAEARLIQAEAEAKALAMIAAVLQDNPDLLTYQYITKLAPEIQVMLLPSNAPFLFPLPETQPR